MTTNISYDYLLNALTTACQSYNGIGPKYSHLQSYTEGQIALLQSLIFTQFGHHVDLVISADGMYTEIRIVHPNQVKTLIWL